MRLARWQTGLLAALVVLSAGCDAGGRPPAPAPSGGEPAAPPGTAAPSPPGTAVSVAPSLAGTVSRPLIWEAATGRLGCPGFFQRAAVSPDGRRWAAICDAPPHGSYVVAVAPAAGQMQVWEPAGGLPPGTVAYALDWLSGDRFAVAWGPDGPRAKEEVLTVEAFAPDAGERLQLGRLETGKHYLGDTPAVWFSSGSAYVAWWGDLYHLDLANGAVRQVSSGHCGGDWCVYPHISPDGGGIFWGGVVIDAASGAQSPTYDAGGPAWAPDGGLLAFPVIDDAHPGVTLYGEAGGRVYGSAVLVVDRSGQPVHTLRLPDGHLAGDAAWGPGGRSILVTAVAVDEETRRVQDRGLLELGLDGTVRRLRPARESREYLWNLLEPPLLLPGWVAEGDGYGPRLLTPLDPTAPLPPQANPDTMRTLSADTLSVQDHDGGLWTCAVGAADCRRLDGYTGWRAVSGAESGWLVLERELDGTSWMTALRAPPGLPAPLVQWNELYWDRIRLTWQWDEDAGVIWAVAGVPPESAQRPRLAGLRNEGDALVLVVDLVSGSGPAYAAGAFPAERDAPAVRMRLEGAEPGVWLGPTAWDWDAGSEPWREDPLAVARALAHRIGLSPETRFELAAKGHHDPSGTDMARVTARDRHQSFEIFLSRQDSGAWYLGSVIWGDACSTFPRLCAD